MDFHQPVKRPTKNSALYHLFPTPLYAAMVENFEEVQSECDKAIENVNFDYNPNFGMTHKLSAPNFKTNIIVDNNMTVFMSTIQRHVANYLTAIEFEREWLLYPNDPLNYRY